MNHIWSILCQNSSIDMNSNSLSLFSCIEEMSILLDQDKHDLNKKIIIPVDFQLISFWTLPLENQDKDFELNLKCELFDPNSELISSFNNEFKVPGKSSRFRNRANIKGFPISVEGRYFFNVSYQINKGSFELLAKLPVDVKINYRIMTNK